MDESRDYIAEAERMKARLADIKRDPERALFSDFKGVGSSGAVTVWVDLLGRLKRVEIKPGSLYEGGESWLTAEITTAYREAVRGANFLNYDVADFAREIEAAPGIKQRLADAEAHRRQETKRQARQDDDYFDGGFLR